MSRYFNIVELVGKKFGYLLRKSDDGNQELVWFMFSKNVFENSF